MAKKEATLILKIKEIGTASLKKIDSAITKIGQAGLVAGAALAAFMAKGVASFKVQEDAVNRLNQAMVNNGDFTREASNDLQKFASELQKVSTFGDEAIIGQLALAKSFGVSNEEAKKMVQAAANLSAATGMELESAVKNLGKTFAGMTGELGESVPALRNLTAEELKAGAAIDLVAEKFKGSTEAQIQGLGSITQLQNALGDFMELVGKSVAPIITVLAKRFTVLASDEGNVQGFLNVVQQGFMGVVRFGSFVVATINSVGGTIGTVLAASIESVSALTSGQFAKAAEIAKMGQQRIGEIITEEKLAHEERMDELELALDEKKSIKRANDELLLKQSLNNKNLIEQKAKQKEITDTQKHHAKLLGMDIKAGTTRAQFQVQLDKEKENARAQSLSKIATLSNSNNKTLAALGKAAALTQIAIDGPMAVTRALAAFPPPINFAAAAAVGAAVAAQAASVAGVQLAEGGIVQATPGGVQATIGEGGRDEAVIPLEDSDVGLGGNITIVVNGGLLGDESSARELATALDQELFKLRKSNQSVAFDEGII